MPRRHPADPGPSRNIGERIGKARRASGLTQRELAALLAVSVRSVQAWEEGTVSPYRRLGKLAALLGTSEQRILYGDEAGGPLEFPQGMRIEKPLTDPIDEQNELSAISKRLHSLEERVRRIDNAVVELRKAATK
jgi:transcriptional regulator with XRE-family HTH domain